jgi:diguanylate cyclase (GGDEF)-like protein
MAIESTKVLLVDDDPAMLRLVGKWLEAAGYQVVKASDGRVATELIVEERPSILLTDWEMPNMDGIELCQWVRAQHFSTYLYTIILTARSDSEDMLKALEAGADDFVKKPVDRHELLARMRSGSRVTQLERQINRVASTDTLTGLATRRTLIAGLEREWQRAQRHNSPLSCVMLDIDFFKRINDTYGHAAGDETLRQIGQVLVQHTRSSDIAGRYGGEEFCIVLPETPEAGAAIWAERIRAEIAALKINVAGKSLNVTASLGVAERQADIQSPEQLVDHADQALLVGKRSGRDRVVTCGSLLQNVTPQRDAHDPAELLREVAASTVMKSIVAPLNENDTVASASNYFLRLRIHSAPVVDERGMLTGILSEKDVMAVMLGKGWWKTSIKDAMKRNVVCYEEQTPALTIYEFLTRVTIRSVVIVNRGRPTGMISRDSFLRFFINTLAVNRTAEIFPEVDAAERAMLDHSAPLPPEDRIVQAVRLMAAEANDLQQRISQEMGDLLPCVVGGASRMQEVVNDLLALSRYAHDATQDPRMEVHSQDAVSQGLASMLDFEMYPEIAADAFERPGA